MMRGFRAHVTFQIICSIILLVNSNSGYAQEGTNTINWLDNGIQSSTIGNTVVSKEYFRFTDASYDDDLMLPKYLRSIPLSKVYSSGKFEIQNPVYEVITDSMRGRVIIPERLSDYLPSAQIFNGRNNPFLMIDIFPIRRNLSGLPERLVAFDLVYIETPPFSDNTPVKSMTEKLVQTSVLSQGQWYKIKIYNSGIYKITFEDLQAMNFTDLTNIRVYGNGGKQLSYLNNASRPEGLQECPIYIYRGGDGIFNAGDYILFFAEGPVTWTYEQDGGYFQHHIHAFSDATYYFLTTDMGPGKTINTINNQGLTSNISVNSYDAIAYYEKNLLNLIQSGRDWYSERFDNDAFDTTFNFQNIILDEPVHILLKAAGHSGGSRTMKLKINDVLLDTKSVEPVNMLDAHAIFASEVLFNSFFLPGGNDIKAGLEYQKLDMSDEAYIDYIILNSRCTLNRNNDPYMFRDIRSVASGNIAEYTIGNVNSDMQVWDITNLNEVFAIQSNRSGNTLRFKAHADSLRQYALVDVSYNYPRPEINPNVKGVGPVVNQDLHGLSVFNYIIVAPEIFNKEAEMLANFHKENSNLSVVVVNPEQIYNEFSSGAPDVSALRDFFRYQYKKDMSNNGLRYVLLFGDGSYNNHMYVTGNTNYILTYQSQNSLYPIQSYVTDDFFGLLDDNEGESIGQLDIGIGRLPVKKLTDDDPEALQTVEKIISYSQASYKDWRRTLCFVGDDGFDGSSVDGIMHMRDADTAAKYVERTYPGFIIKKIYLDAYQQQMLATGPAYPEASDELIRTLNQGLLIFNYNGHGGRNGITGEKILQLPDLAGLKNGNLLPLYITATCEFGRYDYVIMEDQRITGPKTAAEAALLNNSGGCIGLFTTSRVVYADSNHQLNMKLLSHIFEKDEEGNRNRLGDIIRLAKNDIPQQLNKLNFSLLGDPALILAYPEFKVITDSINGSSVDSPVDTLKAFGEYTVSGFIADGEDLIISDFNGFVYPRIYDKKVNITTLGNDGMPPFNYQDYLNMLYKGKATVTNGRFQFSFKVPKDISYQMGKGKISYYSTNDTTDAYGEYNQIYVGGTSDNFEWDYDGPDISLYMNNDRFIDGGVTNKDPNIYAVLTDENGINTTGIGIGHNLIAELDYDIGNRFVLNDYYESFQDDYSSGSVLYPLFDLDEGQHSITLKAWDIYNNSSEETIQFIVEESQDLLLNKLINYPNPACDHTIFQYSHNMPGLEHELTIRIFDLSGNLIHIIYRRDVETGFVSEPVLWDLKTSSGNYVQPGVYPYHLEVRTVHGVSYLNQKLIIIR